MISIHSPASLWNPLQFDGELTQSGPKSETFVDNITIHTETVPEPASALLLAPVAGYLLARRRRRAHA